MLRVIVIGDAERRAADAVKTYAEKPENVYVPKPGGKIPGNDPRHVLWLGEMRCVFSVTSVRDRTYRHLSTSVGNRTTFPNPAAVQEAAHLLGFQGVLTDWDCAADAQQGCVVVLQQVKTTDAPALERSAV